MKKLKDDEMGKQVIESLKAAGIIGENLSNYENIEIYEMEVPPPTGKSAASEAEIGDGFTVNGREFVIDAIIHEVDGGVLVRGKPRHAEVTVEEWERRYHELEAAYQRSVAGLMCLHDEPDLLSECGVTWNGKLGDAVPGMLKIIKEQRAYIEAQLKIALDGMKEMQ